MKDVEVDPEVAAAIERGIRAADEDRSFPAKKFENSSPIGFSNLSTPSRR
jgi:hypothetical protein